MSQFQQHQQQPDDDNFDDLALQDGEMQYGQEQQDVSLLGVVVYMSTRFEEAARIMAANRVQHLVSARDEKIRQNQLLDQKDGGNFYTGARSCFGVIYRNQGLLSLWQGATVQIGQLLSTQIVDQINQRVTIPLMFNGLLVAIPGAAMNQNAQLMIYYACYGAHTLMKQATAYPFKTVYLNVVCQLPCGKGTGAANTGMGINHYLNQVKANEEQGYGALYRGFAWDVASQLAGTVFKIAVQSVLLGNEQEAGLGQLAKVYLVDTLCSAAVYPLNVMGNRLRLTVGAGKKYRYQGIADLTKTILDGSKPEDGSTRSYLNLWRGFKFASACNALDIFIAIFLNVLMQ